MAGADARPLIVAGTGPAGLLAALTLARFGRRIVLIGPDVATDDRRTTALMSPALDFLRSLDLLDPLTRTAAPLRTMRIIDATARLLRSPTVTFHASEIGQDYFGLNIPNAVLLKLLEEAVVATPEIDWLRTTVSAWHSGPEAVRAELADGSAASAPLAVAADGRSSPARAAAGIDVSTKRYPQSALVLNFAHARPHGFISTELHTETGPFTQVPLPGNRSSLVWVEAPERARDLAAMDDGALSLEIERRMQSMLGRVTVEPGRQVYPLSATLPRRFGQNRIALVGEAAHVFPPIGAQGLNLGLRDVQDLVRVVRAHPQDPGAPAALAQYDAGRRPDVLARSAGVDLLNRSLLSDMLPAQIVRGFGLTLLGAVSPLRAFLMREGLKPGSGFSGLFADLGKQVRR